LSNQPNNKQLSSIVFWNFLLLLIIITPTIQYRVDFGQFSFSLLEPIILLTAFLLFGTYIAQHKSISLLNSPSLIIITAILILTIIARPWSNNWKNGISDIRDWLIPWLAFLILMNLVKSTWGKWYSILLVWMFILAVFGIYQHLVNGIRPFISDTASFKTGFELDNIDNARLLRVSYAAGFFSHPNSYGLYMLTAFLLALGWIAKQSKYLILGSMLLASIGIGLYWSYSKSSILMATVLIAGFFFIWWIRSLKLMFIVVAILLLISGAIAIYVLPQIPPVLFSTFWWRVGLWKIALQVINQYPIILLLGNGMDIFGQYAYYPQPHSLYIYILLQYGLPGFSLVLALILRIFIHGWVLYRNKGFSDDPRILGLWLGLVGYFIVGLTESTLFGIENRVLFIIVLSAFEGLCFERKHNIGRQVSHQNEVYSPV